MEPREKEQGKQAGRKPREREKKPKERPKYNMWQNSAYMIAMAVREKEKKILLICTLQALTATAGSLTSLYITPAALNVSVFSVVFQDFSLTDFTLGQTVAARSEYDRERAVNALEKAGFGERLRRLEQGLDTYLSKTFSEEGVAMSGGEKQKIALARALYKDAPFIVLDEPTAALDPIAEAEVYSKFNDIIEDKTAIYISHRLSSCKFCDEILVFDEGHIVQHGSHDALVEDERGQISPAVVRAGAVLRGKACLAGE